MKIIKILLIIVLFVFAAVLAGCRFEDQEGQGSIEPATKTVETTGIETKIEDTNIPETTASVATLKAKIAFVGLRSGSSGMNSEIFIMNAYGSDQVNLTNNQAGDGGPSFSTDGSKIAFASNRDRTSDQDNNSEIYIMNTDGSEQTRLTDKSGIDVNPSFSPDDSKIVFESSPDGNYYNISIINVDGSGYIQLTDKASNGLPCFSPDGSKIAFASDRDGNFEIYIMNVDGSEQTKVTMNPAAEHLAPSFSPDGSKIAFASNLDQYVNISQICIINVDGSGYSQLTDEFENYSPCFSN
jgi:Tol biopolymer transport system component